MTTFHEDSAAFLASSLRWTVLFVVAHLSLRPLVRMRGAAGL